MSLEKILDQLSSTYESKKFDEIVTKCTELLMSSVFSNENKKLIFSKLLKIDEEFCYEILGRWRDLLPYNRGEKLNDLIKLLFDVLKMNISSHEKMIIACQFYNLCFLQYCYKAFKIIISDKKVSSFYKLEAIKFLYSSLSDENVQFCQERLLDFINGDLEDDKRYNCIRDYDSKKGVKTKFNFTRLNVDGVDEDFLYTLYGAFFYKKTNDITYRILSAQRLLQMKSIDKSEKDSISEELLKISQSKEFEENTRACACDTVLRLGSQENKLLARTVIREIGFSADGEKKSIKPLTFYDNSQNVHDENIERFVEKFLENVFLKTQNEEFRTYQQVKEEINEFLREEEYEPSSRHKLRLALKRMEEDSSTFTVFETNLTEILCRVWMKIGDEVSIRRRLVEELIHSEGKCSSAYASNMVNALSENTAILEDMNIGMMDWKTQLENNVKGRIEHRIRLAPGDVKDNLVFGSMEICEDEERRVYIDFIRKTLKELEKELHDEFVSGGYITKKAFDIYMKEISKSWLLGKDE